MFVHGGVDKFHRSCISGIFVFSDCNDWDDLCGGGIYDECASLPLPCQSCRERPLLIPLFISSARLWPHLRLLLRVTNLCPGSSRCCWPRYLLFLPFFTFCNCFVHILIAYVSFLCMCILFSELIPATLGAVEGFASFAAHLGGKKWYKLRHHDVLSCLCPWVFLLTFLFFCLPIFYFAEKKGARVFRALLVTAQMLTYSHSDAQHDFSNYWKSAVLAAKEIIRQAGVSDDERFMAYLTLAGY